MKAVLWIGKLTLGNKPLSTTTLLNTWCLHLAVYTETVSSCWQSHTPAIPAVDALVRLAAASRSAAQPERLCAKLLQGQQNLYSGNGCSTRHSEIQILHLNEFRALALPVTNAFAGAFQNYFPKHTCCSKYHINEILLVSHF